MNTKIIDLEVDYIDSRTITQKELVEISTYIRTKKLKTAMSTKRNARCVSSLQKKKIHKEVENNLP